MTTWTDHIDVTPTPPKRFLVFAGRCWYALGGWDDLIGSADTLGDAKAGLTGAVARRGREYDWVQVVDLHTGRDVYEVGWGGLT